MLKQKAYLEGQLVTPKGWLLPHCVHQQGTIVKQFHTLSWELSIQTHNSVEDIHIQTRPLPRALGRCSLAALECVCVGGGSKKDWRCKMYLYTWHQAQVELVKTRLAILDNVEVKQWRLRHHLEVSFDSMSSLIFYV